MASLFLYAIKSAFVLSLLYVPYTLVLRREKMHRLNRFTLLGILLLSLVLPLCNVSMLSLDNNPVVHAAQQQMIDAGIPIRQFVVTASAPHHAPTELSWFDIVSIVYILGMMTVLLVRLVQLARMGLVVRGGSLWQQEEEGVTIYCHANRVAPFSWLRSIVISEEDYNQNGREIILHERGHILCRHSLDILLLTLVEMLQWWNPLCYMLGNSLRDVHEYEADDYVLRQGVSARAYQMLLINKAVGSSSYTFANNFNHSLIIKRITMMKKQNSSPWRRSRVLYVLPVSILSLCAFATPRFINPVEQAVTKIADKGTQNVAHVQVEEEEILPNQAGLPEIEASQTEKLAEPTVTDPADEALLSESTAEKDSVQDADRVFTVVDELPKYGQKSEDLYVFLANHIRYPKEAQELGIQGRIILKFVVEKDGNVSDFKILRSIERPETANLNELNVVGYSIQKKDSIAAAKAVEAEMFEKAKKALEDEAVRVIKLSSGKWTPGKQKGKKVRVTFTLPIAFRLN